MVADRDDKKADTLDGALTQFVNAYVRGERPDIDEFVGQYPKHEAQIRQRVGNLREIDALFDSIVQTDADDFEQAAAERDLVGQKVGNFEIVEMIGRGGMGVVYLAHDTKLKRSVAVKSMPVKLAADSTARMRFRREAELLASLNHPNIAVIHEIVEDQESGYLILEYVPGETLSQRIAREPLTVEQALSTGKQIARAISAAHKKGIVHRDLKPGNVKITPDGRVKVLDFGLAKVTVGEGKLAETTVTQPGRVLGTPAYMSPEQARGKDTDRRTDVWSFGCIMYQMLTGHLPFEGETATDTLVRIIERQPDWEALPQETPTSIRALLHRCLEKDPGRRPGGIAEAITEITETLSAPPATSPRKLTKTAMLVGAALIIVLTAVGVWFTLNKQAQHSSKAMRLVVLPFDNLGPAEEEWFADGMTGEITNRLLGIRGLDVIWRHSAGLYKDKEIATTAKGLNVEYVLEGEVQWDRLFDPNSTVITRVRLIDAAEDTLLWGDSYTRDINNIQGLQSEVAGQVARALDIVLREPEPQAENSDAYVYYVRGREYVRLGSQDDIARAIQMYERAIARDPNYARAYAALSNAHTSMYWVYYDRSEERLVKAEKAARRALELDPDLPQARMALGRYYYQGHLDFERALEQYAIARKNLPNNNTSLLRWTAIVQSRQAKFEEALVNLKRAYELNPASTSLPGMIAHALRMLRRYEEEQRYLDRLISLAPDRPLNYVRKAESCLFWQGDIEGARATLEEARANTSETAGGFFRIHDLDVTLDIYSRDYPEALNKLLSKPRDFDDMVWFIPNDLRLAEVYRYLGNEQLEQQYYKSAVAILEEKVAEVPNDCRFHSALGKAYAGLGGREQDAVDEGKLGVKYRPVEKDAHNGPLQLDDLARIYVMVGKYDEAIDILERLLRMPSELSVPWLRLDPVWDPLRNHPRFKRLTESGK